MNQTRPIDLKLIKYRFPVTAIVSIFHRLCGLILFLYIPFLLGMLACSLSSAQGFEGIVQWVHTLTGQWVMYVLLCVTAYHLLAGLRHMLMDCGFGESRLGGCVTAYSLIGLSVLLFIVLGCWVFI